MAINQTLTYPCLLPFAASLASTLHTRAAKGVYSRTIYFLTELFLVPYLPSSTTAALIMCHTIQIQLARYTLQLESTMIM